MNRALHTILIALAVMVAWVPASADNFRVMWYNDNYPPLTFVEDNQKTGIINDLLIAVCGLTGDTFTYIDAPFPRAMVMFEAGDIDIEPSVSPQWRMDSKNSVYTIPYRKTVDALLFADKDSFVEVTTPEDLAGLRIGVVRGYNYPGYDKCFADGTLKKYESRNEDRLLEKMCMGRVDVIIAHKAYAQYMMKVNKAYRGFVFGAPVYDLDIMMRFNDDSRDAVPRFNEALEQLKSSGELERILDKYR